ncbi:argonaute-like protein [Trametes versicolor FP-101664 SS1]|uniref:argonaute-like protein n=1 Tax=Trametes versicolor (strain FP-101664) TaxID=717944 RepID=UPI0004623FA9|nr:argonaute-like protein [Trametes versicolor FP-101664 SS1]EIW61996.1 argonaute-like protein [Trametes versicolor FP-101664 SS1]
MPPRANPTGSARGTGPTRGGRGGARGGRGVGPVITPARAPAGRPGLPDASAHITTVGVKRTAFGSSGRAIQVSTNHFEVKIPEGSIYHYDVISPSEKTLPARLNMEIIEKMQTAISPQTFTPRAVYDGRKNMFAARQLPFGASGEFDVTLGDPPSPGDAAPARPPKVYKVKLTHVATINPEVLARFLQGKQSHDNTVLTAITALNVVIRMEPSLKYPFNVRSFFTDREKKDIGSGIVLWRGYFQSVRPAIGRMLINVDISTGAMYKPGPLLNVAMEFMGMPHPSHLDPRNLRDRIRLQRFLSGVRIVVEIPGQRQTGRRPPRVVKRISANSADEMTFVNREGQTLSVADYFKRAHNYQLRFPKLPCIEVGSGALIPMEVCHIFEGQIMRKQVPPEKTKDVLDFATKKPHDRLASIKAGLGVLAYGQSEYVRQFGLVMAPNAAPLSLQARVLEAPVLQYGPGSRQPTIRPRDGQWNMVDKKFWKPSSIKRWCIVVFERKERFRQDVAEQMVKGLLESFEKAGVEVKEREPVIHYGLASRPPAQTLREAGNMCYQKNGGGGPDLIVAVLPEASADLYMRIKHFGDITQGVATQCLRSNKCTYAKAQYYANVCLKINVKLGGINTVPDARSVPVLTDPHNPTIVMGADVIHPAPGADGRPSFTSLVGNVDSDTAKYIADCRVQTSRQEMIDDLQEMAHGIIKMHTGYRNTIEKKAGSVRRIIFFRDGVSEGQFKHVLEYELPQLRAACVQANVQAKITVVVVGKRHHVRFFPQNSTDADRSGNCPAGTVVDRDIVHPTEFDFYLQSHSGLLGTSRPAHYSVLYDENGFTPDSLQALSFALCHVYARSTRSVSIPAPVYYADIVCARAKNHYDPDGHMDFEGSGGSLSEDQKAKELEVFKAGFKTLHAGMRRVMYFS